jgi:hypothetical protein
MPGLRRQAAWEGDLRRRRPTERAHLRNWPDRYTWKGVAHRIGRKALPQSNNTQDCAGCPFLRGRQSRGARVPWPLRDPHDDRPQKHHSRKIRTNRLHDLLPVKPNRWNILRRQFPSAAINRCFPGAGSTEFFAQQTMDGRGAKHQSQGANNLCATHQ